MRKVIWCLCLVFLLGSAGVANAASAPYSTSSVNGYFLGFETKAFVSANQSGEYLRDLQSVCERKGRLWTQDSAERFTCEGTQYIAEAGDGPVVEIKLKSTGPVRPIKHARLFSTRPFAQKTWTVRQMTQAEVVALRKKPFLDVKKYGAAVRKLHARQALVIEPLNRKLTIFIVPWKVSGDGIVDDKDFIVAARSRTGQYSISELRGSIVGYVDLAGKGIPSIQVSANCDGICESVYEMDETMQMQQVIFIATH